jgi:deoxycytidine triphosphate deaminase
MEAELLSVWEALKAEQHEHSKLRATTELVCDALEAVQVRPGVSSLWSRLGVTFERARTQVKEALHLRMRRALAVFRSHYQKIDLEALSEGYVDIPEEELDAIDEEVLEPAKTLAAKFEEEVVLPPLDLQTTSGKVLV